MKITNLLYEASIRDIRRKFEKESPELSPYMIDSLIGEFNMLKSRGVIPKELRDISKLTLKDLRNINRKYFDAMTNREVKRATKKDSIKVADNRRYTVIIPLTENSSRYYGKSTKWCTSANFCSEFNQYFGYYNVTIFIVIEKELNERFAVTLDENNAIKVYNADDSVVYPSRSSYLPEDDTTVELWNSLDLTEQDFFDWYYEHYDAIEDARIKIDEE